MTLAKAQSTQRKIRIYFLEPKRLNYSQLPDLDSSGFAPLREYLLLRPKSSML